MPGRAGGLNLAHLDHFHFLLGYALARADMADTAAWIAAADAALYRAKAAGRDRASD